MPADTVRQLVALLSQDRFRPKQDLTTDQIAAQSYGRARFLATTLGITAEELATDPRRLFVLHEWVGLVDGVACTALSIHYCLCLGSLLVHGQGRPELEPFVAELERFDSVGVFLATELGHGNDVGALETEAVYDEVAREFTLRSPKPTSVKFMPNTAFAVPRIGVVMARLVSLGKDRGVFPFLVRIRDRDGLPCSGIRIVPLGDKPGYALDNAITAFDGVRLPKAHLLSGSDSVLFDDGEFESRLPSRRQRFLVAMDRVQIGRVCFTSACAAVVRAATWIAVRYTAQRESSAPGKGRAPLLAYRNVQRDVFGGLASAYALTFAVRYLQRRFLERSRDDEQEVFRLIAALKATVSAEASELLPRLRERCGAVGMLAENRVLEYWNQLQGVVTAEGDNQLMLLKVGRMLFDQRDDGVPEAPSVLTSRLDPDQVVSLLRYREACLKEALEVNVGVTRRVTRDPFAIWNDNVNATLALASAHGTRLVAQNFRDAVADCRDTASREHLATLFSLWSAAQIERVAGWFIARGCLSREWLSGATRARDTLCAALEAHVEALAGAFGLENSVLRVPIAESDYVSAYHALLDAVPTSPHASGSHRIGESGIAEDEPHTDRASGTK
jgi:acyl-CoA oxidase